MPVFSLVPASRLHRGLIFDPEHYHPDRLDALTTLGMNATERVSDYFEEIVIIRAPGENPDGDVVFDLTDALAWLLADGKSPTETLSAKKVAQPGDIIISRLRSYLREVCITLLSAKMQAHLTARTSHFGIYRALAVLFGPNVKLIDTTEEFSETAHFH